MAARGGAAVQLFHLLIGHGPPPITLPAAHAIAMAVSSGSPQQLHVGDDVVLVLVGQDEPWARRARTVEIADDEEELPVVFDDVLSVFAELSWKYGAVFLTPHSGEILNAFR